MSESGYVYLVTHANAQGLHKIGLTRNPEQRTNQLGGDDCTVIAMVMCVNPEHVESLLHKRCAANRIPQSEWFNLNREELVEICVVLLAAHEEATKYVVLPDTLSLPPPERKAEPKPIPVVTPQPTPAPNPAPTPKWQSEPTQKPIGDCDFWNYRASDWEEVTPSNTARSRKVIYIPGRGYCARKNT